jgi:predicted O-methyltransferase YrrM
MSESTWSDVDGYIERNLVPKDDGLARALRASVGAGLPEIQVSPAQGRLLHLLVAGLGARRILEIGTLGGYSSIWMARALPSEGRILSLEKEPKHAEVARRNFEGAGVADKVEVRVGSALETLPALAAEKPAPYDLVFIDADKPNTPAYFDWAVRLTHRGSMIVVDNVVRNGALADATSSDANVRGMREFVERAGRDRRVQGTVIQTVGTKGYDGFALFRVVGGPPA